MSREQSDEGDSVMETWKGRTDDETGSPTQIMPSLGRGGPPPKAGTQPVLDRSGEAPFMPTPGLDHPLLKAGNSGFGRSPSRARMQPGTDRFVETSTAPQPVDDGLVETLLRAGKQPVTDRFAEMRAGMHMVTEQSVE